MKKLFLSLGLIVINCSVLFAEEITITTYYPSPYGSYNDLTANQMKIGSTYSGTGTFESNGLLVEGNVGIGTDDPQARLHVVGDFKVESNVVSCDWKYATMGVYEVKCQPGEFMAGIHYEAAEWTPVNDVHNGAEVDRIWCCSL